MKGQLPPLEGPVCTTCVYVPVVGVEARPRTHHVVGTKAEEVCGG